MAACLALKEYFGRLKSRARAGRGLLAEMVFPERCLACGVWGEWLCPDCAAGIRLNQGFRCAECHSPSAYGAYCPECRPNFDLDGLLIACGYKDKKVAPAIKACKYRGLSRLSWLLADLLLAYYAGLLCQVRGSLSRDLKEALDRAFPLPAVLAPGPKILIPVPLHPRRLRWRGFNQSALLAAKLLARRPEFRLPAGELRRRRSRRPQAGLTRRQRKKNLKNAFAWHGPPLAPDLPILLIDDVATTGATLNECAKTLKQAGARNVWGLVLAQG